MIPLKLFVGTFVLVLARIGTADAQAPDLPVLSTNVELVADYARDTRAARSPARVTANPQANMETEGALERMGDIADRNLGKKYRLSIVVRNDGAKVIRAVTFEYLLGYWRTQKSPSRVTFKAKKLIKPTETVTVSHSFSTGQYVILRPTGEAIIKRITYADGSAWPN